MPPTEFTASTLASGEARHCALLMIFVARKDGFGDPLPT
jgi:hypothetical protein